MEFSDKEKRELYALCEAARSELYEEYMVDEDGESLEEVDPLFQADYDMLSELMRKFIDRS